MIVLIEPVGAANGVKEKSGFIAVKGKAVALVDRLIVWTNGILETAGFADDGNRAIAHGDELRKAAGLKKGGNEERITAGIHLMRQLFIVLNVGADASLIGLLIIPERILIAGIAGSQNGNLDVSAHQLRHDCIDQIKPLLIRQPGDDANQEFSIILLKPQSFLKGTFIDRLFLKNIIRVISGGQQPIRAAVPNVNINAVYNAAQLGTVIPEM